MSYYYTTNSTYGAFYKNSPKEVEKNREKKIENFREKYDSERPNKINESMNKRINSNNERLELNEKGIPLAKYIIPSLTGLNNLGNTCYINSLNSLWEGVLFIYISKFKCRGPCTRRS